MKETSNQTTIVQISRHLRTYSQWMKSKGTLALKDIIVISDKKYKKSIESNEIIFFKAFIKRGISCL